MMQTHETERVGDSLTCCTTNLLYSPGHSFPGGTGRYPVNHRHQCFHIHHLHMSSLLDVL